MQPNESEMLLGFLIYILYPLAAIFVTSHKKHSDYSLIIFLSMAIGLGPIVGTYLLMKILFSKVTG
jgi:hypothetical protein